MANFKKLPEWERQQRKRARAQKKQARKNLKRRARILAGLNDPFLAAMIERAGVHGEGEARMPLQLVSTYALRRRVAELNSQCLLLAAEPPPVTTGDVVDEASPVPIPEADPVKPPPATREPRRRGRSPALSSAPLLPLMTDQSKAVKDIFRSGPASYETGLGRWHRCPCCRPPLLPTSADQPLDLRVLPTSAGELVFHCHHCGWSLDSVEFVQKSRRAVNLAGEIDFLACASHLAAPLPAAQLAGYQRLAQLRVLFDEGRQRFTASLVPGSRRPALFGDWALLSASRLRILFSNYRFNVDLPTDCWARISVDVFGRWSCLHLHQPRGGHALYRLRLRPWEPAATTLFFLSQGSEFLEWGDVILCEESNVALAIERGLRSWEPSQRLPVALLERCTAPLEEPELPFWYVWTVVRGSRSGRFALPFCTATSPSKEERVRLRRVPEDIAHHDAPEIVTNRHLFCDLATAPPCLPALAEHIAVEKDRQPLPIVLADVLGHPGIHPLTRHKLLREVSARMGVPPEALVEVGSNPWSGGPYALNAVGGTTYIAREGKYWRRGSRESEFTAVTNFRLRLVEDRIDGKGRLRHHAMLEIGEKTTPVSFGATVLESPKRLLALLTEEARKMNADYPVITDPKAKRLLPDLVKATQPRPPTVTQCETGSRGEPKIEQG